MGIVQSQSTAEITQRQFVVGVALMTARTCSALPIGEVGRQQKLPQSAADGRPPGTSGTSTYLKRAYRYLQHLLCAKAPCLDGCRYQALRTPD